MLINVFVMLALVVHNSKMQENLSVCQLTNFKEETPEGPIGIMTTRAGSAIEIKDTDALNSRLIFNELFMDDITHFARERIPERVVHAKGGGAFGYFEVTHDITPICEAKLFSKIEKTTPIAVRFSPVFREKGGIDTSRDARGFAIKFYTEDGNFDIAGLHLPIFPVKDPLYFSSFGHSNKRNPATNLFDSNSKWDFITLRPESLFFFLVSYGDRGIPDGYRHMPGFSIHTYQVNNKIGEKYFVRFHFYPTAGIKNLGSNKARQLAADDPDYATKDLYNAIARGEYPTYEVKVQILTEEDIKNAKFDVFDVTMLLPESKYPLHPVGRLVLDKNPINYFAEIEQLAFCPGNLVPGILGAPDKLFEARRLSYRDAQNYRQGANFAKIPVNCPLYSKTLYYSRDGSPPVKDNMRDIPNYYPNSFNGPAPYVDRNNIDLIEIVQSSTPNNFVQAREWYTNMMSEGERQRLVDNILFSIGDIDRVLQDRVVKSFTTIHPDLGQFLDERLSANRTEYFPST